MTTHAIATINEDIKWDKQWNELFSHRVGYIPVCGGKVGSSRLVGTSHLNDVLLESSRSSLVTGLLKTTPCRENEHSKSEDAGKGPTDDDDDGSGRFCTVKTT